MLFYFILLRVTKGVRQPNLQVCIMHARDVCSMQASGVTATF